MIVSYNRSGITNRIKCLLSSMRIGEYIGHRVGVCWPPNEYTGSEFQEVFKIELPMVSLSDAKRLVSRQTISPFEKSDIDRGYAKWKLFLTPEEKKICPSIDLTYNNSLIPEAEKDFLRLLSRLEFVDDITSRAKEMSIPGDTVAVQIRSWSMKVRTEKRRRRRYDINKYIKIMDQFKGPFFVSADHARPIRILQKRYGKRIIVIGGSFGKRTRGGITKSLVEALVASRCKNIIGSHLSTFTELTWWLSGCKSIVNTVPC